MNYTPNTFKSSGQWYILNIVLMPDLDSCPTDSPVVLDANGIVEFSYTSELNRLLLTGKITYVDEYGFVDKLLEQQQCACTVIFAQNNQTKDGEIANDQLDKQHAFMHTFIVDNIKITNRSGTKITYDILLVSSKWYNCIAKIAFSNNNKDPESVFNIIKSCIGSVGLTVDKQMFDMVATDVKLNYATQANDNLFTATEYLMDKLYFYGDKDSALKFLYYDWKDDVYSIFDLQNKNTLKDTSTTVLSFFKSNAELLIQQDGINIGSLIKSDSKTLLYQTMFQREVYNYDLTYNAFIDTYSMKSMSIIDIMNRKMSFDDYVSKYHFLAIPQELKNLKFVESHTYWNNAIDIYQKMIDAIYSTGSITLNITGDILRQCGYAVTLGIDRDLNALNNDSIEELEKLKTKYTGFEGTWFASKVISIVRPNESLFRQKIALFRNCTKLPPQPDPYESFPPRERIAAMNAVHE